MADYASYPVMDALPREGMTVEIGSPYLWNGEPWQRQEKVVNEPVERVIEVRLQQLTGAERMAVRDFFDARRGRYGPFWFASHKRDYIVTRPADGGTSAVYVEDNADAFSLSVVERHVFDYVGNQRFKIDGPMIQPEGDIRLAISPALDEGLAPGDALQNLYLVRFAEDELAVKMDGFNDVLTEIAFTLKELQRETP